MNHRFMPWTAAWRPTGFDDGAQRAGPWPNQARPWPWPAVHPLREWIAPFADTPPTHHRCPHVIDFVYILFSQTKTLTLFDYVM
jgi:hypothetical protein